MLGASQPPATTTPDGFTAFLVSPEVLAYIHRNSHGHTQACTHAHTHTLHIFK